MSLVPLGRLRKPTAIRVAEGMRGHRPLPEGEPRPRAIVPPCPEWLPLPAQEAWGRLVDSMTTVAGWVTEEQWALLERWALSYHRWRQAEEYMNANGLTYEAEFIMPEGKENEVLVRSRKAHPEAKLSKEYRADLLRIEAALGIGPVFKARVNLTPQGEDEDLDLAP